MNESTTSAALNALRQHINGRLIGQAQVVDQVLIAMLAGGHVLVEGVPGLGKTLLVQTLADSLLAVVLCYLQKPGAPLILGGLQTVMDAAKTTLYYGSPELHLTSAAITEVYKWLGLLSSAMPAEVR